MDTSGIEANLDLGILTINLPHKPLNSGPPRKIPVEMKQDAASIRTDPLPTSGADTPGSQEPAPVKAALPEKASSSPGDGSTEEHETASLAKVLVAEEPEPVAATLETEEDGWVEAEGGSETEVLPTEASPSHVPDVTLLQ